MRHEYHPTASPEIVSGHCPPDKRELATHNLFVGAVHESPATPRQIAISRAAALEIVGAIIDRPRDFVKQNHIAARR